MTTRPPPKTVPDRWPNRTHSQTLEVDGIRWHVQVAGHGPAVLLLHGTAGSTHQWEHVLGPLTDMATVVAPDLPGHAFTHVTDAGRRGGAVFGLEGMAAAVAALCTALGVVPSVIAGHSAGAAVGLRMTLDGRAAPRQLIGLNPAFIAPPDAYVSLVAPLVGAVVETRLMAAAGAWLAQRTSMIEHMLGSSGATLTEAQRARYRALCAGEEHVAAALAMMSRWDLPALLRDAASLQVPLAAYAGERDRWVPPAPLARAVARIPTAAFTLVPGVGHLIPDEAPEVAVAAVREALAQR